MIHVWIYLAGFTCPCGVVLTSSCIRVYRHSKSCQSPTFIAFCRSSQLSVISPLASSLCGRRGCLLAPKGNLFSKPQRRHFRSMISAHGFRPPLLSFCTMTEQVDPSISTASQPLQIEFFILGDMRICVLRDTDRRSELNCLEIASAETDCSEVGLGGMSHGFSVLS